MATEVRSEVDERLDTIVALTATLDASADPKVMARARALRGQIDRRMGKATRRRLLAPMLEDLDYVISRLRMVLYGVE